MLYILLFLWAQRKIVSQTLSPSSLIMYAYDEWQLSNSHQDPHALNKQNTSNSCAPAMSTCQHCNLCASISSELQGQLYTL